MDLESLYNEGFIPGPLENEEHFFKRITFIKELCHNESLLIERCKIPLPSLIKTFPYFLTFRSNKGLMPWQGALTWIFTFECTPFSLLQLRPKPPFFVKEEEILKHEYIHFLRSSFQESHFEEILAYQTSSSFFRRFWGPLLESPGEAYWLLGSFLLTIISPLIPLITFSFFFLRLCLFQTLFKIASHRLKKAKLPPEKILLLLRDREIIRLALNRPLLIEEGPRKNLLKLLDMAPFFET